MKKLLFFVVLCLFSRVGFAEYTTLHLIGDASTSKWDNGKAIPMDSKGNGVFSWTGPMWSGQFKFMLNKGVWADSFVATLQQNEPVVFGTTHALAFEPSGGNDYKFYLNQGGIVNIIVDTENLTMKATLLSPLISPSSTDGKGKRIVNIYGCSGRTGDTENPYKLLLERKLITTGTGNKWCDSATDQWVILSMSGIYSISGFGFRDGQYNEAGAKNLDGYRLYASTTGVEDGDWTEIINESGLPQTLIEKLKTFTTPVEARYLKFVPVKPAGDNYIRIYGMDVYGEYVRPINPEIISTGKTIVDYAEGATGRETPANILDGNLVASASLTGKDMVNPWAFFKQTSWAVIDLEETYPIAKFVLTDSPDWINGYKVSVCNSLEGTPDWNVVFDGTFTKEIERKEAILTTSVEARYVKLEIPAGSQNGWSRIREFEVYRYIPQKVLTQSIYIDFGKNDGTNGNSTVGADTYGHYWNNAIEPEFGKTLSLVDSENHSTGFELEITKKFSANGMSKSGGIESPDPSLLGDFAIGTATQDYFYIESTGGNGSFKIKNLDKNKAYKFHVFGTRLNATERSGYLSFTGANGSHGLHVMGGPGIGANGVNQNNNTIYESDWIFPDLKGEVLFQMAIKAGGFAYINIMKIEEYTGVEPLKVEQKYYIDFGREDGTNGNVTQGADDPVNTWNNVSGGYDVAKGTKVTLANSLGNATSAELELLSNFRANGKNSGALLNPDPALLGDLAIQHATEDYLFIEGGSSADPGKIGFYNLNPKRVYRFHVFGSRYDTNDRMALMTFTGDNTSTGSHKMSGTGIGMNTSDANIKNQNNSAVYVSDPIRPTADGQVIFDMVRYASNFSHINAMKIEECSDESIVRPTSLKLTCPDITVPGQSVQVIATVLPENSSYNGIKWEIDDKAVALLTSKGLLSPKKNGTVKVKASIELEDKTLSDEIQIHISGQLGAVNFSGTASEDAGPVEMRMITNNDGILTNNFEIYTSLKAGSFTFSRDMGNSNTAQYGAGATDGTLAENGNPIENTITGPARITINLTDMTYVILPITSLNIVGNAAAGGSDVTTGSPLLYQGNGVWFARLTLNKNDNASFYFVINKTAQEILMRNKGTNGVVSQSQATQFGIATENVRTNMNGGPYDITLNLRDHTYSVSCGEVVDLKISYMGSSVSYGAGAMSNFGWAYMYTNLLKQRTATGEGLNWATSNISIGGNNTTNLLDRFERDLLSNCSSYVIYALSLGNEGIHENGLPAYNSYHDGMLKAIKQARDAGIVPVMANNYTRADFTATDYNYVKTLNLLIHEWDVPSINVLGAIDDGAGRWAYGYESDNAHPNTAGHDEFFYAMVPSLFDALEAGKPLPARVSGTSCKLGTSVTDEWVEFTPENIVHPFTISFDVKTSTAGTIAWFESETGNGFLKINSEGKVVYESPKKGTITSSTSVKTGEWKRITLTHYYAWGVTMLYINDVKAGELQENLAPKKFALAGTNAPAEIDYRELFFWRAGMNAEEIQYVNAGKMMKSSLEIYAPLGGTKPMENLAQSTNTLKLTNTPSSVEGSPLISVTPSDGLGARIARLHSNTGGNTNETADNLLLDKNVPANKTKKWCYNASEHSVVIELSDFYDVDKFEIDDCMTRENGPNFPEYYIYVSTTGTASANWTEVVHEKNQADVMCKVKEITPTKAKYIKFVPKGINTIRIFGFRIYGNKSTDSVHPEELISVGKPVIDQQTSPEIQQSAVVLFDANKTAANSKWTTATGDKFVVVDLKDNYSISKFILYDARSVNTSFQNIDGYKISVSKNLSTWDVVVDATGRGSENTKTDLLEPAKEARYVKLEIPEARMGSDKKVNLYEFEIYQKTGTGINSPKIFSVGEISVYPNPVTRGENVFLNETGLVEIYSVQGQLVYEQDTRKSAAISTRGLAPGSYIIHLVNDQVTKYGKLLVK